MLKFWVYIKYMLDIYETISPVHPIWLIALFANKQCLLVTNFICSRICATQTGKMIDCFVPISTWKLKGLVITALRILLLLPIVPSVSVNSHDCLILASVYSSSSPRNHWHLPPALSYSWSCLHWAEICCHFCGLQLWQDYVYKVGKEMAYLWVVYWAQLWQICWFLQSRFICLY